MLRARGQEIFEHVLDNATIQQSNLLTVGRESIWNVREADRVQALIREIKPDIMKVDNFYPLLSPSIFKAAKDLGVPTVLSVRNYRLVCPSANIFRDGHVCTLCVGKKLALPAIRYRCYRDSYAQSASVVASNAFARVRGVWHDLVDRYVAVSSFVKNQLVLGGYPEQKIVIKPNFISDSGIGDGEGGYALYVGRLTEEKGIRSLIDAWQGVSPKLSLKIIGDGPLEPLVQLASQSNPQIEHLGRRPLAEVIQLLGQAAMLIFPSVWYEPFGRSVVEAYSKGTPVVAAATPPMQAMIQQGRTGLLYTAGDAQALSVAVNSLVGAPETLAAMRRNARERYLEAYTEKQNYEQLMAIFRSVMSSPADRAQPEDAASLRT